MKVTREITGNSGILIFDDGFQHSFFLEDEESFLFEVFRNFDAEALRKIVTNPVLMNSIARHNCVPKYPVFAHGHRAHYIPTDYYQKQKGKRIAAGRKLFLENVLAQFDTREQAENSDLFEGKILLSCLDCAKVFKVINEDGELSLKNEEIFDFSTFTF